MIFRRPQKASDEVQLTHSWAGETLEVSCNRAGRALPVAEWSGLSSAIAAAVADAQAAAEDGRTGPEGQRLVELTETQLRLDAGWVAGLESPMAMALGLPATTSMALDLKPLGRIDQDAFRIGVRWVRPGGQPGRATLQGAFLTTADGVRRVPEPLWSLHRAARALAEPMRGPERFRSLADLRAHWPQDARIAVESDAYLADLRVHYASSLSLKLGRQGAFDFDPVLFGAARVATSEDAGLDLDEEADSLLSGSAQKLFAEDRFRREPAVRPVYVLRDGEYVVIDPALRPALDVVRKLQDRPEAERREFVLNPRRVLREQLGEIADHADLDRLFVETQQFSERVAGVDLWRAPVLPWLVPSSKNEWLPERFGLRIADDYVVLPPENVAEVLDRLEAAVAKGLLSAEVPGLLEPMTPGGAAPASLPVNAQVLEAVRALEPFARFGEHPAPSELVEAKAAVGDRLFLVVRENLDEVEFAPFDQSSNPIPQRAEVTTPGRLKTVLKAHQLDGLGWLAHCAQAGRPGALLADDMGLGKTLQAVAFMAWLQDEAAQGRRQKAPFLIVAPTGLLGTWRDEIAKHLASPRLGPILPAFGPDLRALREDDSFGEKDIETGRAALKAESWRDAGVVVTTYETLRDYHFSFARTPFGLIVYDEVQKLKNPASQLTRAAKTLNSAFTLGMTGTPVENRLQDLWSIMDVVAPGLLGSSRDFERRHHPDNVEALGSLKATLTEGRHGGPAYMLRRLKADALQGMPSKHVHTFEADMPPAQATAYRDLVVRAAAGAAAGTVGKGGMLSILAAMRGVSLHPLDPRQATGDLAAYAKDSARLAHTLIVLEAVADKGEKALIFVEDLAMQERLAGLIQSRFGMSRPPMRINGGVPGPRRQEIVQQFQGAPEGFDVMILSPKAGGVGLTLTAANHVIHLSRWWNPAVEDQATDRVFRIGQTRDVHVHLPLAVHPDPILRPTSFDLRLNALIERKRGLTRDLFLPPEGEEGDLAELFREVSLSAERDEPVEPDLAPRPTAVASVEVAAHQVAAHQVAADMAARNLGAQVWRAPAGAARPTAEILQLFAGADIRHIHIRDPYALARAAAREAQVELLVALVGAAQGVAAVTVEYAPDAEGDLPESAQRREFGSAFAQSFQGAGPRLTLARRPKRSRDDDFHDRFVELEIADPRGRLSHHTLILGRGAEALFDLRKECTVSYAPGTS